MASAYTVYIHTLHISVRFSNIIISNFSITVGSSDKLGNHLSQLLGEAEMRLQEFGYIEESCSIPINSRASFSSFIGTAYPASAMTGTYITKKSE